MIAEKTGSLIATSGRYGGMFSGCPPEQVESLRRFGAAIGTAFQISDDIIDITSPSDSSGKTPGTDLREGVHTLPMLYALQGEGAPPTGCGCCSPARSRTTPRWPRRWTCCARARAWPAPREVLADQAVGGPRGAGAASRLPGRHALAVPDRPTWWTAPPDPARPPASRRRESAPLPSRVGTFARRESAPLPSRVGGRGEATHPGRDRWSDDLMRVVTPSSELDRRGVAYGVGAHVIWGPVPRVLAAARPGVADRGPRPPDCSGRSS